MKLSHLGFIIISLILIIIAISVSLFKNKEGFSIDGKIQEQKDYLKRQDNYFDHRLFPQVVKGGNDDSKFLKLNDKRNKLVETAPSAAVDKTDVAKKIEQCRIVNETKNCDNIESNGCGYCWDSDKIIYGDANGPATDVCSKNGWVPPGPQAAFKCRKMKEQALCNTMKDCGDSTGERSICGWCPNKNKGMPKKRSDDGGWEPKYDDDVCDWKEKVAEEIGKDAMKCTDLEVKIPNSDGSKKWWDIDGPSYDCNRYSQGNNCKSWGNRYARQGLTGNKACCACGGGARGIDFKGILIQPEDCERFKQMFPCVGPNMTTGPHTNECLASLWSKGGCTGSVTERASRDDFDWWNSHGYGDVGNNMKNFKVIAETNTNYENAKKHYKKCFGSDVNPCENRFRPRPLDCSKKLYNETGCSAAGKLNPELQDSWPNGYVGAAWKSGQNNDWSVSTYKNNVLNYKAQAQRGRISSNTPQEFDNAIYTNMLCYGTKPEVPFDKPCWKDFIIMMTVTEYIKLQNGRLSFAGNTGGGFKALLPVSNTNAGWRSGMAWVGNYELTKQIYEMKYFPFWNFVATNKQVWNSRWSHFKNLMLKVPSVKGGSGIVTATWRGWGNSGSRNINEGQGDCDYDSDCKYGLRCKQNPTSLPGVNGNGLFGGGRDFCYDPNKEGIPGASDYLIFKNGSPFDTLVGTSGNVSQANNSGNFARMGNDKIITKQAYMHEKFPYWYFIRVASRN